MSSRPSKRPAHFDTEERESPKRPRQTDQNGSSQYRNTTNGGDRGFERDRRERNGAYGGDRDRDRDRRGIKEEPRGYGRDDRYDRSRDDRSRDAGRRSPPRRQRSRERERSQDRGKGSDSRYGGRTNGTSAPSSRAPPDRDSKAGIIKKEVAIKEDLVKMEMDGANDEDAMDREMMRAMGFAKFKTTKNTKVPGNDKLYAVRKEKKMTARQYMNRPGGFNRPLSPSAQG